MAYNLGDIKQIDGHSIESVDCVIGGSPCQDLSLAGRRAGLSGERSGLYMEQIRVIKEMRERDIESGKSGNDIKPRYMVWENVPGAFSSNKGKDFAAVLEEAIKIIEPEIPNIEVPKGGWPTWGGYRDMDGRWSLAWRVLDAQYWGVPSVDVESHLSWILEETPQEKYYLSQRACRGILDRAARRGKKLPKELQVALEVQAGGAVNR